MLMKRIVLLVSFCCIYFITQAQEFIVSPMRHCDDTTVIVYISDRSMREDMTLIYRYLHSDDGKRFSRHEEVRKEWLRKIKSKVLTKELKHSLKDMSGGLADQEFRIYVYVKRREPFLR